MADIAERTIDPAIWLEEPRGGFPDRTLLGLSGLEQLRSFLRSAAPRPPLAHLTGMRPTHVGPGTVTFLMPATGWLLSPVPYVSLGALAMLADSSLGCTVQSVLAPATPYTTSDLSLSFIRPTEADGGDLAAHGRLIHAGRSLGVADVLIEDTAGRPVAHGTTRCFVLPKIDPAPVPPDPLPVVVPPTYDTPDPFERPVAGRSLDQDVWDDMTGLEIMRALADGRLPWPPISHLTGLRAQEFEEGRSTFTLPSSLWLTSPAGTVQGGAIALLADTALATAVQTTVPRRTAYAPLDLKVNYIRPVFADDRDVTATAECVHRGRTLAVARADLRNADGKLVATATGSTLIREGVPWRPEDDSSELD